MAPFTGPSASSRKAQSHHVSAKNVVKVQLFLSCPTGAAAYGLLLLPRLACGLNHLLPLCHSGALRLHARPWR
jgi:hypothetical protein